MLDGLALFILSCHVPNALVKDMQHFEPNWESLRQAQTPEWFRDAKFGIWAHWGPQSVPEMGDWYARQMYGDRAELDGWEHDSAKAKRAAHDVRWGHPSQSGFKEVINDWKAEKFDPEKLMDLYVRAGAKYFVSMGAHCDNFDLWDSTFQPWNSTKVGPKKNILGLWAKAARRRGLHFGVSIHNNWTWRWWWTASQADTDGPLKGIPYDGNLTLADGKGKWWEGLDPRQLYLRPRTPAESGSDDQADPVFVNNFKDRVEDVIDRYRPDLVYFDWSTLPFRQTGLDIAAHYYNQSANWNRGQAKAVINVKDLPDIDRTACVLDVERGQTTGIEKWPYQTDTCFGDWFYNKATKYKTALQVIHMLADVVSKNGTLLLNVPLRPSGEVDQELVESLETIGKWLHRNGAAIYGSRPWKLFGEGPTEVKSGMFGEQLNYSPEEIRYTTNRGKLYAILYGAPNGPCQMKSLGSNASPEVAHIRSIKLLGTSGQLKWTRNGEALSVTLPAKFDTQPAYCLEIDCN
jgi:alpha-L-fucosidase